MKSHILELDLQLIGKNIFNDIPNEVEFEIKESDEINDLESICTIFKKMVKDYLTEESNAKEDLDKDEAYNTLSIIEKICSSLDMFLTSLYIKIGHNEKHDNLGSFTWVYKSTNSRKRITYS